MMTAGRSFVRGIYFCLIAGVALAALGSPGTAAEPAAPDAAVLDGVRVILDVPYYQGADADPVKHMLDLYLPEGRDFPVLFFIHGGAWRHGDKQNFGLYSTLGMFWARHGVGVVVPNYRLTPAVRHPAHIQDVARAFAWTRRHIAEYGGRPDEIFVGGHSAGGHLAALLATDDAYLRAEGMGTDAIRGVIPMSGVYDLSDGNGVFEATFGHDADKRSCAAPICHVRKGLPPFLIIYADNDLAPCGREPSERFGRALRGQGDEAETLQVPHRNHLSVLLNAVVETDPVPRAVRAFIVRHSRRAS